MTNTPINVYPPAEGEPTLGPLALYGYYPLYVQEYFAESVGNGTTTRYVFNGIPYYMPGGVTSYTGDWPADTIPEENGPFSRFGYYPLYNLEVSANGAGNGSSTPYSLDRVEYYMPNGVENFNGNYPDTIPPLPEIPPLPPWGPDIDRYNEINFPAKLPSDAGFIHYEVKNDTMYRWDGVKWDPYTEHLAKKDYWTRNDREQILTPADIDDYIRVDGVKDDLIDPLP